LDRLVASGLAERVPYRGVRVPILEPKEIVDAFLLRLILETTGARLAATVIQPDEARALSLLVEKTADLVTLEDMSTLRQLNKQFHTRLVEAARSPLLNKLYEMTTNAFPDWMLYEYMFRHPELLQSSPMTHKQPRIRLQITLIIFGMTSKQIWISLEIQSTRLKHK
jgi:DNA-binding GntR family transcriptional regulator